jgi:cytochrome c oxidase assembly protein subunit 15
MVKSGLEHERFGENQVPRVSPYRLATHLGFAWTVYSLLLWNAWDLLRRLIAVTAAQQAAAARARPWVAGAAALIGTTVASGAFVAGNDAGHAYNDWPLFAGKVVPEQIWDERLGARNFFENTATVQFDHRNLAYASVLGVGLVHMALKRASEGVKESIHPSLRRPAILLGALVGGQALLGISTLLMYVPVSLGAAHQAGALALWTGALYTLHSAAAVAGGGRTRAAALAAAAAAARNAVGTVGGKAAAGAAAMAAVAAVGKRREEEE